MNGRTYLCATGYIWKRYANEGFDILMQSEQKGTSMEIEIYEGNKDKEDGLYDITDYGFLGVTCLGDDVESGMYDTTITKYASSKTYKKELEDIYREIFTLENRKEEVMEEVKETVEVVEAAEEVVEEPVVEITEEVVKPEVEETIEEIVEEEVQEEVEEPTIEEIVEPKVEEATEEVIEEKSEYSMEELIEKLGAKEIELNSLMDTIASYEEELKSLREFKATKEREALVVEVDMIAEKFTSLDKSEIEVVKTRVLNAEITTAEFEKELYYLVGVKALESKANYAAKIENMGVSKIIPVVEEKEIDQYGGLLKKHNLV